MIDIHTQRRRKHYNNTPTEHNEKGDFTKITLQLIVCMAVLVFSLYGVGYKLPDGNTAGELVGYALTHKVDISVPFHLLRNFVSEKIGPVVLPDSGEAGVFNETTSTKSAN